MIAVVNREKQPSHAIYSSDAAARIAHLPALCVIANSRRVNIIVGNFEG